MKKSLLIVPALFVLASCVNSSFSGIKQGCVSNYYSGHIESIYEYCDGSAVFEFEVKQDQSLVIRCEITSKSGEINFSVSPKGQDSIFAASTTEDDNYDVDLPDFGRYKIVVNTNSHSGSYLFDWTSQSKE